MSAVEKGEVINKDIYISTSNHHYFVKFPTIYFFKLAMTFKLLRNILIALRQSLQNTRWLPICDRILFGIPFQPLRNGNIAIYSVCDKDTKMKAVEMMQTALQILKCVIYADLFINDSLYLFRLIIIQIV